MSPDRTLAALRWEVYLRKPEVFKMACLRDIMSLFGEVKNSFYAGFSNRLTDALSYRLVNISSTRIYTIDSNGMIILDLLTLMNYKSSYMNMHDDVDHFFPPVSSLTLDESFTDFNYWRSPAPDFDNFSDSDDEEGGHHRNVIEDEEEDVDEDKAEEKDAYKDGEEEEEEEEEEDEEEEEEEGEGMGNSFISTMSNEVNLHR